MAGQRFFINVLGTTYAILNAPVRRGSEDVVCLRGLTPEQQVRFAQMKDAGDTDERVFYALFPPQPRRRPRPIGDLGRLPKKQIADLLRSFVGDPLPSLEEANKRDLQALCRFLLRSPETA
jgi:hypothetical protein